MADPQQDRHQNPIELHPHHHDGDVFGGISTRKLLFVAVLGGVALLLGASVVTMQLIFVHRQRQIRLLRKQNIQKATANTNIPVSVAQIAVTGGASHSEPPTVDLLTASNSRSVQPMRETREEDLFLWKRSSQPYTTGARKAAQHYWNQVLPFFQQWDATLNDRDETQSDQSSSSASASLGNLDPERLSHLWISFEEAVHLGHADAQFAFANYAASGIPPFLSPAPPEFSVSNRILDTSNSEQLTSSLLFYHMAAMDGHVEAALAMGYRQWVDTKHNWASLHPDECQRALPYYEAAAHGIIDRLEADKHSRAYKLPPMDGHVLSELHSQGTHLKTGNTYYNAPDEPAEALQYFHMRATQQDDVGAAYTLGQYYYHGIRGVQQNMTKALFYYDLASTLHHWESAGLAGMFHIWGLGMEWYERNLYKAHKYFLKGAPFGVEECRKRHWRRKAQPEKNQCDARALTGLGLLHVLGVPMVVPIDLEKANAYFQLAQEMGSAEARYHMAMMRLGWKTYWVELHQLRDQPDQDLPTFMRDRGLSLETAGPTKADYIMAIQDLVAASQKGHLQAKHRLGMMYADGVNVTLSDGRSLLAIKKECPKALKHFHWLAEHASPYLSQRLRRGYEQHQSGDYEASLRNYMTAAETGNLLAQINAAFLLEQGVCLGMKASSCASASMRLWKGACTSAIENNPEACLHVGDIFYYGRLRSWAGDFTRGPGPFGWLPFVLYPEKSVWPYLQAWYRRFKQWTREEETPNEETCDAGPDGTCLVTADYDTATAVSPSVRESDLAMAARYYDMAARRHKNPRGNFNLGFMHEWGLGLKQDFPLAKRHYDLAASVKPGEADVAVQIALVAMKVHERIIKHSVVWREIWGDSNRQETTAAPATTEFVPKAGTPEVGHPVPSPQGGSSSGRSRTRLHIIMKHVLSWETLLIVILTWILTKLFQYRRTRR